MAFMSIIDGRVAASRVPRMNLTVARPAKLWQSARKQRQAPHMVRQIPTYLPTGKRVINHKVGNSIARYPK